MPEDTISTVPLDTTVAIIVPLYGLVEGEPVIGLNAELLQASLSRMTSSRNKTYTFFVGEGEAIAPGVIEVVTGKLQSKSAVAVNVPVGATYGQYVNAGIQEALATTQAKFFIVASPTQMLGLSTVDALIEGLNKGNIGVLSAFDLRKKFPALGYNDPIAPTQLDGYQFNPPRSYSGVNINLFGIPRPLAEIRKFDEKYRSVELLQQDTFYTSRTTTNIQVHQAIPTYSFELDWSAVEPKEAIQADADYFKSKWGFMPQI